MTELIFQTIHGSHLYGLAHESSDDDMFYVTTSTRTHARQHVDKETGVDPTLIGLDAFLTRIYEGSHQSVEALFSPFKVWGTAPQAIQFRDYLSGMRITGSAVFAKYERTITKFCYGDFKRRRHACRLSANLTALRVEGRFNPIMSPALITWASETAEKYEGEKLWETLFLQGGFPQAASPPGLRRG